MHYALGARPHSDAILISFELPLLLPPRWPRFPSLTTFIHRLGGSPNLLYTGWAKKSKPDNFCNNFVNCQPIFIIFGVHVLYCRTFATRGCIVSPPNVIYVTTLPCKILTTTFFTLHSIHCCKKVQFLQRVSIACNAERCISYDRFCPTVRLTVRHCPVSCQNDSSYETIMRSSLQDSPMILVSWRLTSPPNSKGNIGSEGAEWERGSKNVPKIGNF